MQAITTKYHGPTNSRGSRIVAKCAAGTLAFEWVDSANFEQNHRLAAEALARKLGRVEAMYGALISGCAVDGSYVHVWAGDPHYIVIRTRTIPATDTRNTRVRAACDGRSITVGYDYGAKCAHRAAAQTLADKFGWGTVHKAGGGYFVVNLEG